MKVSRYLILATLLVNLVFVVGVQLVVPVMPWLVLTACTGLVVIIGAYLGLDLSSALTKSFKLPQGVVERVKPCKYIFSIAVLCAQIGSVYFLAWYHNQDFEKSLSVLYACYYLIVAYWIAGRKLTKIAHNKGTSEKP